MACLYKNFNLEFAVPIIEFTIFSQFILEGVDGARGGGGGRGSGIL